MKKSILFLLSCLLIGPTAKSQFQQINTPNCSFWTSNNYVSISSNNNILTGFTYMDSDPMMGSVFYTYGVCAFNTDSNVSTPLRNVFENFYSKLYALSSKTDTLFEEVEIFQGSFNFSYSSWRTNDFGGKTIPIEINDQNGNELKKIATSVNHSHLICKNHNPFTNIDSAYFYHVDIQNNTSVKTSSLYPLSTNSSNHLSFTDDFTGFFVCTDTAGVSYIKRTNDHTQSWTNVYIDSVNILTAVYFSSPNVGYAVGLNNTIVTTNNGGASWQRSAFTMSPINITNVIGDFYAVDFVDDNIGYIGGNSGALYRTIDGGLNWTQLTSNTTERIIEIVGIDDSLASFKTISKNVFRNGNEAVSLSKQYKSEELILFPNPFSNTINIHGFGENIYSIEIFDLLGKITKSIINPSEVITTNELNNGVYLIKVHFKNNELKTFKLIKQ